MANNCYRATDSSSLPHHICSLFLCPSRRGISRTIQIVGHHRRFINDSVVIGSLIISAMTLNIITRLVIILPTTTTTTTTTTTVTTTTTPTLPSFQDLENFSLNSPTSCPSSRERLDLRRSLCPIWVCSLIDPTGLKPSSRYSSNWSCLPDPPTTRSGVGELCAETCAIRYFCSQYATQRNQ